jgi:CHASE2 domain-containing sensor protein
VIQLNYVEIAYIISLVFLWLTIVRIGASDFDDDHPKYKKLMIQLCFAIGIFIPISIATLFLSLWFLVIPVFIISVFVFVVWGAYYNYKKINTDINQIEFDAYTSNPLF